jgi:acetoin utilization protein AcuB
MLVRDIMQSKLITIDPTTTLPQAIRLAAERRIRHLPVVDGGELVGIVSDRDLKQAMASPATSLEAHELSYLLQRLTVDHFMTRTVITVRPGLPVAEAARLMLQERISALPVTDDGRLIGIITETDLLELLVRTMKTSPSSRPGVLLEARV